MTAKASGEIPSRYELVDSNGLVSIRLSEKEYVRAHDFRRYLHKNLEDFIVETPLEDPLDELIKDFDNSMISSVEKTWKPFDFKNTDIDAFLDQLTIDKSVKVSSIKGGYSNALQRFNDFLSEGYSDCLLYTSDAADE